MSLLTRLFRFTPRQGALLWMSILFFCLSLLFLLIFYLDIHSLEVSLPAGSVSRPDTGSSTHFKQHYYVFSALVLIFLLMMLFLIKVNRNALKIYSQSQSVADELRDNERKFRSLTTTATDAIIMINSRGDVVFWNPAAEALFGYSKEEALGCQMHDLIVPERHVEDHRRGMQKFQMTGQGNTIGKTLEMYGKRRDGEEIPLEISFSTLPMKGEWYATGIVRDIRQRKAYEAQLQAAIAEADQASQAKSEFLAAMSHEIRTPMNGILGMTELLLNDTGLNPSQQNKLQAVYRSGEALLRVINDILDFSKIEAGKLDLEQTVFSLPQMIDDIGTLFDEVVSSKTLDYRVDLSQQVTPFVLGDSHRLRQILINLLGNAFKFTEQGRVSLKIEPVVEGEIQFVIEDSGIGIHEEMLEHLFEPFTQGEHSTTRRFGGTGLGLPISQRLAELMGGEIHASSRLNQGSCFLLRLPLPAANKPTESKSVEQQVSVPLRPRYLACRVLLVEDNQINQQVLRKMLKLLGIKIDLAENGVEALEKLRRTEAAYELVFMDCQMPEMDGFTACEQYRSWEQQSRLTRLPIIALTAYAMSSDRDRCFAAGMDDFLTKPVQLNDLQVAIGRWLEPTLEAGVEA